MFNDKSLCEEVRSLRGKLDDLERQEYGQKIEKIQKANRELEKIYQGKTEELQKTSHKLAVRLGMLQGIAAVLFAVLSGVAVYYIDKYHADSDRNRENVAQFHTFEVLQAEVYDVLLNVLQAEITQREISSLTAVDVLEWADEISFA